MTTTSTNGLGAGFHRRIRLFPFPNRIVAGLEDNLHFFAMELMHANQEVIGVQMRAERYPWSTCPGASAFLNEQAVGRKLGELARMNMFQHCTHLFELAVICAAHVSDQKPIQFDLHVDDWVDNRTQVRLLIDAHLTLQLDVNGRIIETPGEWFGRDMFQLSQWQHEFDAASREQAMLIARAIYVSLGRVAPMVERAADRGPRVLGVCYSYQPTRVDEAMRMPHSRREFSELSKQPLEDFDPQLYFTAA